MKNLLIYSQQKIFHCTHTFAIFNTFLLRPTGEGGDEAALKPKKRERRGKAAKDVGDDDDQERDKEGKKWETVQRKGIGRDVRKSKL